MVVHHTLDLTDLESLSFSPVQCRTLPCRTVDIYYLVSKSRQYGSVPCYTVDLYYYLVNKSRQYSVVPCRKVDLRAFA